MKHVQIKFDHVWDQVGNRSVFVDYNPYCDSCAESLAKVLVDNVFFTNWELLGVVPVTPEEHGLERPC